MKTNADKTNRRDKAVVKKGPVAGLSKMERAFALEEIAERKDQHLTMTELAKRAGLTRQEISHVEHFERGLKYRTAHKIARGLGRKLEFVVQDSRRWLPSLKTA